MSVSLLASESSSPPEPMKFCRSDNPMPSAPSTVSTDSRVLGSDGAKEGSRSLVSSNVGFSRESRLPPNLCSDSTPRVRWFESKSAGVAGADSIAEEAEEYEADDGGTNGSSSKS